MEEKAGQERRRAGKAEGKGGEMAIPFYSSHLLLGYKPGGPQSAQKHDLPTLYLSVAAPSERHKKNISWEIILLPSAPLLPPVSSE